MKTTQASSRPQASKKQDTHAKTEGCSVHTMDAVSVSTSQPQDRLETHKGLGLKQIGKCLGQGAQGLGLGPLGLVHVSEFSLYFNHEIR